MNHPVPATATVPQAPTLPPSAHQSEGRHAETEENEEDEREATELRTYLKSPAEVPSTTGVYGESNRQSLPARQKPRWHNGVRKFWTQQISITVPHADCRDHLANERTFLAYLRTSLTLSMIGVTVAQLFRIQHAPSPSPVFGYFVLGKPLAAVFEAAAILMTLLGAYRSWRQQNAMLTICLFTVTVGIDISRES
ncbi:hypothetical protein B0A49_02317 [Cryomyces minteri]|uniref:DUF202 domain-containing protein n=1 Tax=Cryomyces minteri TaxID=331657 RepID=A0A4U0XIQ7_9PEZI|nr:hypothetical protein B0A49_02317 [Cryomyces minteri]